MKIHFVISCSRQHSHRCITLEVMGYFFPHMYQLVFKQKRVALAIQHMFRCNKLVDIIFGSSFLEQHPGQLLHDETKDLFDQA